jgi:DNA-directed RNA polymerase subunit M/transcription elongation factor TFIIS
MATLGPAGEWLRLSEHYRQLSDDELIALAQRPSELTDAAQQLLAGEISRRKLEVPPIEDDKQSEAEPTASGDLESDDDPYADDRELVDLRTVWSSSDAVQAQRLLDLANIPFFMGPEKATRAEAVTSNFSKGVAVQVMSVGLPWPRQAMQHYEPANEPRDEQWEKDAEVAVRCPKCHSTEVVFDELINEPAATDGPSLPRYRWTCDACGNEWEDEGVETGK